MEKILEITFLTEMLFLKLIIDSCGNNKRALALNQPIQKSDAISL
jgi:hypothetical protein